MIKFAEHINESLDSSYKFTKQDWTSRHGKVMFVDDDNNVFVASFDRFIIDEALRGDETMFVVEVSFWQRTDRGSAMRPTNNVKNALRVYSTIGQALKAYITEFSAEQIIFTAAVERTVEIYQRLATTIAKRLGGQVYRESRVFKVILNN